MFDRFTDRARKVMNLAKSEAQRLNHEYIGTEPAADRCLVARPAARMPML